MDLGALRRRDGHALPLRDRRARRARSPSGARPPCGSAWTTADGAGRRRRSSSSRATRCGTDHLDVYGYERPTAPTLQRLARGGRALPTRDHPDELDQGGDAVDPDLALPVDARRAPDPRPAAGLGRRRSPRSSARRATRRVSFSSVAFTGQFTNLHQGFEELHEAESTAGPRRARAEQDGARVRRPARRSGSTTTATSRPSSSCTSSTRTAPTSRTAPTTRCGPTRRAARSTCASRRCSRSSCADAFLAAARHGDARRAGEGRPRPGGVHPLLEGLVRRLDPRHGRRDRTAGGAARGARARATARCSPSTPTTARSSTTTAACGTGRASTAR